MIQKKRDFKKTVLCGIFVLMMILSYMQSSNNIVLYADTDADGSVFNDDQENLPVSSDLNLTDYITGSGINQTVRVYMSNISNSQNNNGYFNIAAPADNMYLSYGDFNFSFQNNYTTLHIIEDDNALYPDLDSFVGNFKFNPNHANSEFRYNSGKNLTLIDLLKITDKKLSTNITLNSTNDGMINFTICTSFADLASGPYIAFIREKISEFLISMTYNISKDAELTVMMKDFYEEDWENVTNTFFINSSYGPYHYFDNRTINENLNNIRDSYYNLSLWANFTGTYSFDKELGQSSTAIDFIDEHNGTQSATVIYEEDTHQYVLKLEDILDGDYVGVYDNLSIYQPNGTIEFWYRTNNVSKLNFIELYGDNGSIQQIFINNSHWYYINSANATTQIPNVADPVNDTWMHIRIDFECTDGGYLGLGDQQFRIYVDGVNSGILDFRGINNNNTLFGKFGFRTNMSNDGVNIIQYIDAIGYSWNASYSIGDNIDRVGFVNESNCALIQFVLNSTDKSVFNATIFKFNLNSTMLFELPITNNKQVALEFDLRGLKSTVNGFYAWIRTLDLDEAKYSELNISLYKSDKTVARTQAKLQADTMEPNYTTLIDSFLVKYDDYHGDKLSYFAFDTSNTANLSLFNYFIVIKSNNTDEIYSLVTIPWFDFADDDGKTEHQLKMSSDGGVNWANAYKAVGSYNQPSNQLDASQFRLNVTRGYMPSDFKNNTISLKIQNYYLNNTVITTYPYNGTSGLTWGLGRWKLHDFETPIANDTNGNFRIDLTWPLNVTKGFKFNVTYYAEAYRIEEATSSYNVTYGATPLWTLNYTLGLNNKYFNNWNLTEFWYIFPHFYQPHNLTTPDGKQVFNNTKGEKSLIERPSYDYLVVQKNISDPLLSGSYLLNLTGFNHIYDMHSYINYKGTLWETQGFMFGDNISVRVNIQDSSQIAPENGTANVNLFYPNGTKYLGAEVTSSDYEKLSELSLLTYNFGNQTILNITSSNIPIFGKYILGYFWENGSAIGCKKMNIYIDRYTVDLSNCTYDTKKGINGLHGTTLHKVINNYSYIVASVNETTGMKLENFYPINNTDIYRTFTYTKGGYTFPVILDNVLQNESILNPGEVVNVRATFQNIASDPFLDLNVKIKVRMVSIANEEMVIVENTSDTKLLKWYGDPSDTKEFSVDLTIPTLQPDNIWNGVNAPIRKAGAKTEIMVYIEDEYAGYHTRDQYISLFVNQTDDQFEGHIITLKAIANTTSRAILREFERDECIYLPNKTTFVMNVFDTNYVSSYDQILKNFSLKMASEFTEIETYPEYPIKGQSFNVSSVLKTEFGDALVNKEITCQYYNDGVWETVSTPLYTDINGTTNFKIETLNLDIQESNITIRLFWIGETTMLTASQNISILITIQTNNISIYHDKNDFYIHKDMQSIVKISLRNTGDSNLRILQIKINMSTKLDYSIVQEDNLKMSHFEPDDTINIFLKINLMNVDIEALNMTIKVKAQNKISNEIITSETLIELTVLDKPLENYFIEYLMFLIIALFVLLWFLAIIYAKKVKQRIEAPSEEPVRKRPRRGKYVPVAELKPQEKEKKESKKMKKETSEKKITKKEDKFVKERTTDLDSLLKKEGLDKESKKKGKK